MWLVKNVLILGKVTSFWALPMIVFASPRCVQKMKEKVIQSSHVKRLIWNEEPLGSEGRVEVPLHLPAFVTDLCSPPMEDGMCHFLKP